MTDAPEPDDRWGFDSFSPEWLLAKPGSKWQLTARTNPGAIASWIADMDYPPAPAIVEHLREVVLGGDYGYPDWPSYTTSPMAEVFADRMLARRGWRISPGHVQEFCDVLQAIQTVFHLTMSRGDAVVIHTPCYPPFLDTLKEMGLDLIAVPAVRTPSGWGFDHDELDRQLTSRAAAGAGGGRAKALLLCNPHNPTGHVFTAAELRHVADIAQRHDLVLVSDEVHADLVHAPHRHVELAVVAPEVEVRTVTISSASKAFNVAGLRWACAHVGPAPLRQALRNLPGHLLGVPNLLGVEASRVAWTDPDADDWLAACVAHIGRNRQRLTALLAEQLPEIDYSPGEATYLAWLDCRALAVEGGAHEAFRRAGVETTVGRAFGPGGDGFVRANLATSGSVLTTLVQRMSNALGAR